MTVYATPSSENIYLGAGEVFFNRLDKLGKYTGERHLGNCTTFNVTSESEVKKKYSSMHAARTLYKSIITQIGASGKVSMDEYDPENLALGLFGEAGIHTQAAAANLTANLEVKQGRYYHLGKYRIQNVVIPNPAPIPAVIGAPTASGTVTSTGTLVASGTYTGTEDADFYITITAANTASGALAGTEFKWKKGLTGVISAAQTASATPTVMSDGVSIKLSLASGQDFAVGDTYIVHCAAGETANFVENQDYTVDAKTGRVFIVPGGHIQDGDTINPVFDCLQATMVKVMAGNTNKIEGMLRFVGDPTTGPSYMGEFWHVSIQPEGEAGFIAEDWGSLGIKFECMDQRTTHPEEPFYRLLNI
jgi:hypothetical protein